MSEKDKSVGIRLLKNQASRIVDDVCERKAEYIVTKHGKPVAVLRPWREADAVARHRQWVEEVLSRTDETARQVGEAATGDLSAAEAISRQRRW